MTTGPRSSAGRAVGCFLRTRPAASAALTGILRGVMELATKGRSPASSPPNAGSRSGQTRDSPAQSSSSSIAGPATEPPPSSRFQERIVAQRAPVGRQRELGDADAALVASRARAAPVGPEAGGAFVAELHALPLGAEVVSMVMAAEAADHAAGLEHAERARVGLVGADLSQCSAGVGCADLALRWCGVFVAACAGACWAGVCWRVLGWRVGAHRLAHSPADRSSGGDRHLVLLERDVVEGEGRYRTQRGREVGEPVELRPAWCGECGAGKA